MNNIQLRTDRIAIEQIVVCKNTLSNEEARKVLQDSNIGLT